MTTRASARQVALDVETTGLAASHGHRIIEVGCVEIVDGAITGRVLHQYVDPERDIDAGARRVHGIGREQLRGKPKFVAVLDELLEFVRDAEVLIHNAKFDLSFLDAELRHAGRAESFRERCRKVTDTLPMARRMFPHNSRRLDDLCDLLDVDRSGRTLHGALLDARLLAEVYLRMTGGKRAEKEEDSVQLTYARGIGSPEDAYPATADELFKLYWEFAKKVRETRPNLSHEMVQSIAMEMTEETLKEMVEAGIALPPPAGAWEQYEQRVGNYIHRVQESDRRRTQQSEHRAQWRAIGRMVPWAVLLVLVGLFFDLSGGVILLLLLGLSFVGACMAAAVSESGSSGGSKDRQPDGPQAGAEVRRASSYARTLVRRTKSRK